MPSGVPVQGARRVCNFSVDLGAPAHIVDDRFVSFNLDAALFRRSWDWLELDLENPRLLALCRSLAPSVLRVGGTTSNLLLFSEKNRTTPDPVRDWQNNVLYPEYKGPLVMHGDDWIRLNSFVKAVGWELLFSLNGLNRRSGAWDSSNAVRLLRFSDLLKLKVHWQLGSGKCCRRLFKMSQFPICRDVALAAELCQIPRRRGVWQSPKYRPHRAILVEMPPKESLSFYMFKRTPGRFPAAGHAVTLLSRHR
ncbi:hypothetical protein MRX96_043692 [Rhipicephalus microplus]